MDPMFWLQFLVVMFCVAVGGRLGGVGLGAAGGLGRPLCTSAPYTPQRGM